ncbi:carbohydrate-binding protein [Mariniflexile gromovii]|uniref:Carbohydrate-binding protein n=1 Tax=Mariniflexile gromovii TaxID=362523 RepID=A0ABS4BTU1_9FLAO|nr:carbohydrate-binding protein [Mariniflexile gromovii]MBP0904010.1 carbohydrate-binding protein [Mariniflexile gromovii]
MKIQNKACRFINSILCIVLFMSSVVVTAQSITVNSTNYKQTIDMMGGDIERNSIAVQNAKNKAEIINWGFGDINFNYCRVQFDKNQEMVEGVKNWNFYTKQVATMQQIKAINPNIKFFATMRTDYDGFGNDNNMPDWIVNYTTKDVEIDKYATFLADYLEFMENQGVAIHTMSITKEWTSFVNARRSDNITTSLRAQCATRGITMPLISEQGFWSITQGINFIDDVAVRGSQNQYESFCSHDYQNEGATKWATIISKANALGKKLYNDEFSTGSGAATYGVEPAMSKPIGVYIDKAIAYEAGLSGEIFFEIWSRGIDKETRAIYYPANGTGRRVKGYYIMKQFANNILNHTYMTSTVNAASNVWTITFRENNKMVLWVINKSSTEYTLPIKMDQSTITSQVATHFWTNDTPIEGSTTTYTASGNTFIPTVKGESMNCYIFNVTEDAVDTCNLAPTSLIEAECYNTMLGVQTEPSTEGTDNVTSIENGDWLKFEAIDLGSGATQFSARVSSNTTGGSIELRTDSPTGTLVGTLAVTNTGGLQNWKTVSATITKLTGVKDLYFVFTGASGSLFNVNWFQLKEAPSSVALNISTANSSVALNWTLENVTLGTQNIYRNAYLSKAGKTLIAENVSGTNYTDATVSNGETYYYWVEVTDASSNVITSNFIKATPSIPNLALASHGSVATQSSTYAAAHASLAIDGNTDGNYNNGSVSHTNNGDGNAKWWQVDLQADYNIENITIFNRTGSNYSERLIDFTVEVFDSEGTVTFTQFFSTYPNPSMSIETGGVIGKVVKISKADGRDITLAEVEVYGVDAILSNKKFQKNNVEVYPNPTNGLVTIKSKQLNNASVGVYDLNGRALLNRNINETSSEINISNLASGIYLFKVKVDDAEFTKRIVKQ